MNLLAVVGLLLISLTLCYAETDCGSCDNRCTLDADTQTEWRVIFLGSNFNGNETTFSYKIMTRHGFPFCEDLNYWYLLIDCEDCPPKTTPNATCSQETRLTVHNIPVAGIKWVPSQASSENTLYFNLTYPGHVEERDDVTYVVKGDSRCGYGIICGPDFTDGNCTIIDSPNEPEPECYVDEDCQDNFTCTINQCVEGFCVYTPDNDLCDDDISCTSNVCNPNSTAANAATGCIITPLDSRCDDGFDCTEDTCEPDNSDSNDDGCTYTPADDQCDDGFSCTRDRCNPDDEDAVDGCTHEMLDSQCNDNFGCTDDRSEERRVGADDDGCVYTPNDDFCTVSSECTQSSCSPDDEDAGEDGCLIINNDDLCDDGFSCTTDSCAGAEGCTYEFNDNLCDD